MSFVRLPETVQTLYAELLDQLRMVEAESVGGPSTGSFVSKTIRGRTYWYLQKSEGATKRQIYLGPETPELLERIRRSADRRNLTTADEKHRRELVAMIAAGGMVRESASVATVLRVLSDAAVFRAGGVLVGTQAFTCLANLLGVAFDKQSLRTADIDVAHDLAIGIGLAETSGVDLPESTRAEEPAFFAEPELDARHPSTSFKVRGRDLRVDFLTPARRNARSHDPVLLRHLGVAARPLEGLDYLIEQSADAAIVAGSGIHVNVPSPARFALHKLWVASQRPASEAAKSRKDLRQAEQLLEVVIDSRPDDLTTAWAALAPRRSMMKRVKSGLARIDSVVREKIAQIV